MQLEFRTQRLQRAFHDPRRAVRLWGPTVGHRYIERLALVALEPTWDGLFNIRSLNLHPLHGRRHGEFALRLTGGWRLIVRPGAEPGHIYIIDVEDYHG